MAVTWIPDVVNGYSNLIKIYNQGTWETFLDEFYWGCSWNMGVFLETPNDSVIYPVFNLYRAIDEMPFEKIHEGNLFDTVFHNYTQDLDANIVRYYVTCVYEDGESEPSDTLTISLVNTPEIVQNNKIKVFPNPAKDRVSIESAKEKIKSLSLINSKGEVIIEQLYDSEKIEIDVSNLTGSFYIVRMITDDGVFTSKLLILK